MSAHEALFKRACRAIPGGVNSPVRAFGGVGGVPLYVSEGSGATIRAADGRLLTDYCCSWGAMILGHAHPEVVEAIREQAGRGTTFGINTELEVRFAEMLLRLAPGLERVRLVSSGTEAVMTAIRLARGVTGRNGILKFEGCYHGHGDAMLVAAGSGLLTHGIAASPGIPRQVADDTYVLPYNDSEAVEALATARGGELAAIIVEPVAGNMGLVEPLPEFLATLRRAADRCGALLILDEVITGFRFGLAPFAALSGIRADLITLGKVIGGGLPLAAVGGRAAVMDALAPCGKVYQAGTLAGNPLAVAAGLKTLEILERDPPYPRLAALAGRLAAAVNALAASSGVALRAAQAGGVFTLFCAPGPFRDLAGVRACDTGAYARLFHRALAAGAYLPPSQFEIGFISAAHTAADVDALVAGVAAWTETENSGNRPDRKSGGA